MTVTVAIEEEAGWLVAYSWAAARSQQALCFRIRYGEKLDTLVELTGGY